VEKNRIGDGIEVEAKDRPRLFDAQQQYLHNKPVAMRTSPFLQWNGLACTDSVLAYGHHGWPTASAAGLYGARNSLFTIVVLC